SFNDPSPTATSTLSLHDALPICLQGLVELPHVSRHDQQLSEREGAGADVAHADDQDGGGTERRDEPHEQAVAALQQREADARRQDRKSTRLNSSHVSISYAVFCL